MKTDQASDIIDTVTIYNTAPLPPSNFAYTHLSSHTTRMLNFMSSMISLSFVFNNHDQIVKKENNTVGFVILIPN